MPLHFLMDRAQAVQEMLEIHNGDVVTVFRTDRATAETLVKSVNKENQKCGHSLKCTPRKED